MNDTYILSTNSPNDVGVGALHYSIKINCI